MHTADVVCWGSLAQRSDRSRQSILRMLENTPKECLKVFDINIRQHYYDREVVELSLRHADILKLNEEELPLIASLLDIEGSAEQQIATLLSRYALRYIVHTHGASFSEIYGSQGEYSHIPTPKVQVADTVGAGDSFTAVLVTSLLQGIALHEAHALAVKVSAWVCTQHGAINPLPHDML
jgi:fructokinase